MDKHREREKERERERERGEDGGVLGPRAACFVALRHGTSGTSSEVAVCCEPVGGLGWGLGRR